jgi:PAS domain S-box-containing protein
MSSHPDFLAGEGKTGSAIDVTKRGQAEQATATIVETSDDTITSKSKRSEEALRRSEALLQAELADTKLLQDINSELVSHGDTGALYEKIVAAAVTIMRADFASMQRLYPERGTGGALFLLAFRGFNSEAAKLWERVRADTDCICGIALRRGVRIIEPDVARSELVTPGSPHHSMYLRNGIAAIQSTPLRSRSGELVGMISTHWRRSHRPSERDLRLLDILARQAADLIERTRTEQALARLAAIVETSDDAIISKDLNGIIITWNRGAEQLFGYRAQETIGLPVTILIPPDRIDEEAVILARIRRGERIEHYETVRRRKDGTLVDISLSVSPLLDEAGKVVGASKIARDVTERRRVENALQEADRRKDEFLAMLSHELRNPLAPIRHAVTLLQQVDDAKIQRQACAILDRQVEHMTRLVNDLLDLSRITRGDINVSKQEVDLAAVVEAAIETSRPLVEASGHRLDVTLPGKPVGVVADCQRLAQVVSNLLNNAAKYTPRGGRIRLEVGTASNAATISVRDNGIGIPAEELPLLFGMFTQLDSSRGRAPGGLGVGLALARQPVEPHRGTIEARSDGPGRGSEFTVRIPLPADRRSGAPA